MREYDALHAIFKMVRSSIKEHDCNRAIMVAHNATFDLTFTMAAAERAGLKRNPFHPFVTFDTAALSGLALGQTVLSKACPPPVWRLMAPRRTLRCTTPSRRRSCFAKSSTAGNVLAAGRYRLPDKSKRQKATSQEVAFYWQQTYSAFGSSVLYFAAVSLISCCSSPR